MRRDFNVDELRCIDIIREELECEYIGDLRVYPSKGFLDKKINGWTLELRLNNIDKPMYINYIGDDKEKFFDLVRKQIREDNIPAHVKFYSATYQHTANNVKEIKNEERRTY